MEALNSKISKIGWRFDNSYARLPEIMLSRLAPIPVQIPKLIIFNRALSKDLGLNFSALADNHVASMFSGNLLPQGYIKPWVPRAAFSHSASVNNRLPAHLQ